MLCDNCKKREAVVAYSRMENAQMKIIHLCSECAKEKMNSEFDFNSELSNKLNSFLEEIIKLSNSESLDISISDQISKSCPNCGKSVEDILLNNEVGCELCYENVRDEIEKVLLASNLTASHRGKIPKTAGEEGIKRREELKLLNKLNVAIALEEYEEAAKLRDKLKELKGE